MGLIRFLRGQKLLGQCIISEKLTVVELAKKAGVKIPVNCTSGTCGTCMITLLKGEITLTSPLTPGLDRDLVEDGARLGCIGHAIGEVDVEILPPI